MGAIADVSELIAVVALGLMAGSLVAEGGVLVPVWRSLQPDAFLIWYKQYAALLQNVFGPMEVVTSVLAVASAGLSWFNQSRGYHLLTASAILSLAVLAVFLIYFQRANSNFKNGNIALASGSEELERWSIWHWARTGIA
ncbi:MAG TPA: hypothetical protein VK638_44565, partial [Edaphobacter sp.]|nr:hypothetical protein [Edaphobacter sp.]